ncbi:MAG: transcriptional regulator with GAF, ATPase, and Fis domain [Bacteroidia bacterium]|jgi:transcriptional regulator with GAF, ATPase, and Fis domain
MKLQDLQAVALDVAEARSLNDVLNRIVLGLDDCCDHVLSRIWLAMPGDVCGTCNFKTECPTGVPCLHLRASAGTSQVDPDVSWTEIDGHFKRFPFGVRKVGVIAETGVAQKLCALTDAEAWIVNPVWAKAEGLNCFAGQPLVFRGEVLGVLAVFSRAAIDDDHFGWLRTLADQAAVAIANARAFEEIESLTKQLELERDYYREEAEEALAFSGMVGESPVLKQIARQIELVAPTDASVLIHGESGTGKELIATAIHESSARKNNAMVRVNCAAIPHELFESEFFGHARGSFTGAQRERAGRFQVANGGTLFLDEVGEIPLELQGKLLRVLQEGQFSRIGEDTIRHTDVRVVAATNKDLKAEAEAGNFREDLYYRLNVFPLVAPPLRERAEDIPLLAAHFLRQTTSRSNSRGIVLRKRDVSALMAYGWPGNVRELQNVIERAVILSTADRLHIDLEPSEQQSRTSVATASDGSRLLTDAEVRLQERANLIRALDAADWKVSGKGGAADLLGIRPSTMASRMKAMKVKRPR